MEKFKLAFGIHNHQPVGNFAAVFEDAHQKTYLPFLNLLAAYQDLRISLHQSGILWDWQRGAHPEYFDLVGRMVDRGQLELMTGGFFEPILTSVPNRDALGQIQKLSRFLYDHFNSTPTGLWLTERIWEPHLPKLLAQAEVNYLPVDDTHFIYAGFEQSQLTGPFLTEDEGHPVTVLPIQKRLRYLIPFGTVEEVIAELRTQAEKNPSGLAVYADDGEKFGVWPGTHEHCFTDGWLKRLFEAILKEEDWLELIPLGEAASRNPVGRAYLPTASYEEMLHWALPPTAFVEYEAFANWLEDCNKKKQYGRFVRGGHWRGFLAKYDEANLMHKKMLRVSDQLAQQEKTGQASPQELQSARDHLYAAQCNCPYWHGVFGGLYLPHLRQGVYSHMIQAAMILRKLAGKTGVTFESVDYIRDGCTEILMDSDSLGAIIKPDRGGTLLELCINSHDFNLTDTLSRRREGYHLRLDRAVPPDQTDGQASIHDLVLAKEHGLKRLLVEDWYLKRCFIDHFLADDVDLARFQSTEFGEEGDFVLESYNCELKPDQRQVFLRREGRVRRPGDDIPICVQKSFHFDDGQEWFEVRYALSSPRAAGVQVNFAVENNFSFQAGHAIDRYILVDSHRPVDSFLDSVGSDDNAYIVGLIDEYQSLAVAVGSDRPAEIWRLPIVTVSLSEGGFEKVYQGTSLIHKYQLRLTNEPLTICFTVHAGAMKSVLQRAFSAVEQPG